jgi:biopolymer transport protein ExbB
VAIRRKQVRSVVVLYPKGGFFGDRETDELQKAIMDEAAAGNTRLVLNLAECQSLNSIAIGVLMRGYSNYKNRGGEIKLCGLGKRIKDLFTMTKLIMVFDHHDTWFRSRAGGSDPSETRRSIRSPAVPRAQEEIDAMNRFIVPLGFALAVAVSITIWWFLPTLGPLGEQMQKGGYLVAALILLAILQTSFIIERIWSLRKAQGRGSLPDFLNNVRRRLHAGDVAGAIQLCGQQRGSAANVIRAGLERYQQVRAEGAPKEKIVAETQAAIQEANGLEVPLLERNLIALSTIASIATMIGLLGTVIGMIRSFAALGHTGAVDASKLAIGISEALINTAGGLFVAIAGIVSYNVFVTRVDNFNYMMDEASYEAVQLLSATAPDKR